MASRDVLVPIADTISARQTVDHAIRTADGGAVHVVAAITADTMTPEGETELDRASVLLERASVWAQESADGQGLDLTLTTLAEEDYLFGPTSFADLLGGYAVEHDLDVVVIDPEYWVDTVGPMLATFERELEAHGVVVEEATVGRPARHERFSGGHYPTKVGSVFLVCFGFYLLLGDPFYWFDIVTGTAVAAFVALVLGNVTYARPPRYPEAIVRTIRFGLYVPYLIWEIVKANFMIAAVILHPALPIDPQVTRMEAKVPGGLPLLALANSITLTPGTLTVRGTDQRLIVHTLLPAAREDLFGGRLERAVRFVFFGRRNAAIASPEERGDTEILGSRVEGEND